MQHPVVEIDQRLGFPEAPDVMLAGRDQISGQTIAQQADNAGERRRAAAMHAQNQDNLTTRAGVGHEIFHLS